MGGANRVAEVMGPPERPIPFRTTHEVVSPTNQVAFPPLCVRCGEGASQRLSIHKLFVRSGGSDSPSYHVFEELQAPVCDSCLDNHNRTLPPIAGHIRNRLLGIWLLRCLPYLFPLWVCSFFIKELAPKFLKAFAQYGLQPAHYLDVGLWFAVTAFFGLLAAMFINRIIKAGEELIYNGNGSIDDRYVQIERGPLGSHFIVPIEPTPTMRSVDFTDDRSELFDSERHYYTFTNPVVAEQFAALNAHRTWNPNAPHAKRAATARWVLIAVVLIIGILGMIFGKN